MRIKTMLKAGLVALLLGIGSHSSSPKKSSDFHVFTPIGQEIKAENGESEQQKTITIPRALKTDNHHYGEKSFDLARSFLREKTGYVVGFKDVPLDKIMVYSPTYIIEKSGEEHAEENKELDQIYLKIRKGEVRRKNLSPEVEKLRLFNLEAETNLNYFRRKYSTKGESEIGRGLIRLIAPESKERRRLFNNLSLRAAESSIYLDGSKYEERKKIYEKDDAMTIVHEIGHKAGLIHTHDNLTDSLEEYIRPGVPNAMSNQEPGNGKYGFDVTKEQARDLKDYLDSLAEREE